MTLRDLLNSKVAADGVLTSAQAAATAADTALADATVGDASATSAFAGGLAVVGGSTGQVIDPTANADGSYTVYQVDKSATGYHSFSVPTLDSVLQTPNS